MRSPYVRPKNESMEDEPEIMSSVILERYERCSFCNTKLVFSHDLNLNFLEVVETGQCPGCGVSKNPKKFPLQ